MARSPGGFDLSGAVHYHYDRFPPRALDYGRLILPLANVLPQKFAGELLG